MDVVVAVGRPAYGIADGAAAVSGWHGETVPTAGRDEALAWVRENVAAADVVLVKASRGAALEHIARHSGSVTARSVAKVPTSGCPPPT